MEDDSTDIQQLHKTMLPSNELDGGEHFEPLVSVEDFEWMMFDIEENKKTQELQPQLSKLFQSNERTNLIRRPRRPMGGCPCCWDDNYDSDTDTEREPDLNWPCHQECNAVKVEPSANAATEFHLFPNLPQELQNLIWHHAALFTYRKLRRSFSITKKAPGIKGLCFAVSIKKDRFTMWPLPPVLLACKASSSIASKMFHTVEYVTSGNSAAMGADNPCHGSDMLYVAKMVDEFQPERDFYPIDDSWIWMWAPGADSPIKPFRYDIKKIFKDKIELHGDENYRQKWQHTTSSDGCSLFLQWKGSPYQRDGWELQWGPWLNMLIG